MPGSRPKFITQLFYGNSSVAGLRPRQREAARDGRPTNPSHFSSFVVSGRK